MVWWNTDYKSKRQSTLFVNYFHSDGICCGDLSTNSITLSCSSWAAGEQLHVQVQHKKKQAEVCRHRRHICRSLLHLSERQKTTIQKRCEVAVDWVNANPHAVVEQFGKKRKELEIYWTGVKAGAGTTESSGMNIFTCHFNFQWHMQTFKSENCSNNFCLN